MSRAFGRIITRIRMTEKRVRNIFRGGMGNAARSTVRNYATDASGRHAHNVFPIMTGLVGLGAVGALLFKLRTPVQHRHLRQRKEETMTKTGNHELDALLRNIKRNSPCFEPEVMSQLPLETFLWLNTIPRISDEKLYLALPEDKAENVSRLMTTIENLLLSKKIAEGIEQCSDMVVNIPMQVTGNVNERKYANFLLGHCLMHNGQFSDSRPYLRNAVGCGRHDIDFLKATSLNSLALASEMVGDHTNALAYLFAALDKDELQHTLQREGGNIMVIEKMDEDLCATAIVEGNIGRICAKFGHYDYATLFLCRALENLTHMKTNETHKFKRETVAFLSLTELYMQQGDVDFSQKLCQRAREICEQHDLHDEMRLVCMLEDKTMKL